MVACTIWVQALLTTLYTRIFEYLTQPRSLPHHRPTTASRKISEFALPSWYNCLVMQLAKLYRT
jgi:hypothetical protein